MKTTKEELDKLLPPSDEDYALERMTREQRLPKYNAQKRSVPNSTEQLPQEWIDAIANLGLSEQRKPR